MPLIVTTPVARRIERLVEDICSLQHDRTAAARQRALRWIAHVLQDINSRRRWWFLERAAGTMLAQGEDVVELHGHIDKLVGVYCGRRLEQTSLARITALRQAALAQGRNNAGRPVRYAVENANIEGVARLRVHLWPAPGASHTTPVAAVDTGTGQLTVAANTVLMTGTRVRLATDDTLPAPLATNRTYYVIRLDETHVQLAASLADAKAGQAIELTDAGSGTHSVLSGLTPLHLVYTRPMDLAIVPDSFETIVLNGVLGTFGRHFDRDQLGSHPEDFEQRYERQLARAHAPTWDIERIAIYDDETEATELGTPISEAEGATSYTVPASLTGIGYVTIETGDYPLVVS